MAFLGGITMNLRRTAIRIALKTGLLAKCKNCGEVSGRSEKLVEAQRYAFVLSMMEDGLTASSSKPLQRAIRSLPEEFPGRCECSGQDQLESPFAHALA
jgi:hypothetical protein